MLRRLFTGRELSHEGSSLRPGSTLFPIEGPVGMETLVEPLYPTVDIIFVHGLGGNRKTTWTHQNNTYWPKDLLPIKIPNARIMTFGYDADMVKILNIEPSGGNGLHGHGKSLAFAIADSRSTEASKRRPLIFVAHSLGGLVCEQALLVCRSSNEQRLAIVLESTAGVLFMGTPHKGAELALWGARIAKYVQSIRKVNRRIIKTLSVKSEILANVEEDFQQLLLKPDHVNKIRIFCFYEEIALPFVGKIVPERSAILEQYSNASIHANHMEMARFINETDKGYLAVCGVLKDWIDALNKIVNKGDQTSHFSRDVDNSNILQPQRISKRYEGDQSETTNVSTGRLEEIRTAKSQNILPEDGIPALSLAIPGVISSTRGATFVASNVSGNTFRWDSP